MPPNGKEVVALIRQAGDRAVFQKTDVSKPAGVTWVLPKVVSPGALWAQVEPGLESEALLANCALS